MGGRILLLQFLLASLVVGVITADLSWTSSAINYPTDASYHWAKNCDYTLVLPKVITLGTIDVANFESCALSCAVNPQCNLFSYDTTRYVCYVQHSQAGRQVQPGPISSGWCGYIISSLPPSDDPYSYSFTPYNVTKI